MLSGKRLLFGAGLLHFRRPFAACNIQNIPGDYCCVTLDYFLCLERCRQISRERRFAHVINRRSGSFAEIVLVLVLKFQCFSNWGISRLEGWETLEASYRFVKDSIAAPNAFWVQIPRVTLNPVHNIHNQFHPLLTCVTMQVWCSGKSISLVRNGRLGFKSFADRV